MTLKIFDQAPVMFVVVIGALINHMVQGHRMYTKSVTIVQDSLGA